MESRRHAIFLTIILLTALAARITGLWWGLPNEYHTVTYNPDENTALVSLQGMDPARGDFNPASTTNPRALGEGTFHLYMYAASLKLLSQTGWLMITGSEDFYFRDIAEWSKFFIIGRAWSLAMGFLTVLAVFLATRRLYNERSALIAAFFTAIMPVHVVYSRYLLMNVPGVFWIVLAFIFFKGIIDRGELRDYLLSGACVGFAASTRYSAGPLLLVMVAAYAIRGRFREDLPRLVAGTAVTALCFIAGTPYSVLSPHDFLEGLKNPLGTAGLSSSLIQNISYLYNSLLEALGPLLLLFGIAGAALALAERSSSDLLVLSWLLILAPFFVKAGKMVMPGRILPALPFLAILGGRLVDRIGSRHQIWRQLSVTAVVLFASVYLAASATLLIRSDLRDDASRWIISHLPARASVGLAMEPSWFSPGIIDRAYRHPEHRLLPGVTFVRLTRGDWMNEPDLALLGERLPEYIVCSSYELSLLAKNGGLARLAHSGYREEKRFTRSFSAGGITVARNIPAMFFIPGSIVVFTRGSLPPSQHPERVH